MFQQEQEEEQEEEKEEEEVGEYNRMEISMK